MSKALATLPLQLVCQLVIRGAFDTGNTRCVVNSTWPDDNSQLVPEGYTAFKDIGVAYKYHNYTRSWNLARKDCNLEGAHLAVIDSKKKLDHAMTLKDPKSSIHVGVHRFFDKSEWVSGMTGLPVTTMPWTSITNEGTDEYKCVTLWFDGRGVCADDCNSSRKFICELPLIMNEETQSQKK